MVELTIDIVKTRLLEEELKRKSKKMTQTDSSKTENGSAEFSSQKFKGPRCYKCNKYGHKQNVCPKNKKKNTQANMKHKSSEKEKEIAMVLYEDKNFASKNNEETILMMVDSCANGHYVNSDTWLHNIIDLKNPTEIQTAHKGQTMDAVKGGNLSVFSSVNGRDKKLLLQQVNYVPSIRHNLLSTGRFDDSGGQVIFDYNEVKIVFDGDIVATGYKQNGLYWIPFKPRRPEVNTASVELSKNLLWHRRYAHMSMSNVQKLSKLNMVSGIHESLSNVMNFCLTMSKR